jgi:ribonuclease P protein component
MPANGRRITGSVIACRRGPDAPFFGRGAPVAGIACPPEGGPPRVVRRIQDRATFEALRRSDHRARRGPVSVTYASGSPAVETRVAYAVGRRVGGAVVRNRLRRRLRAVVSGVEDLRPGAYLVAADAGATGLSFGELRTNVGRAMVAACGGRSR